MSRRKLLGYCICISLSYAVVVMPFVIIQLNPQTQWELGDVLSAEVDAKLSTRHLMMCTQSSCISLHSFYGVSDPSRRPVRL